VFPSVDEYVGRFGLTRERAERLARDAVVMHPGPMNRGVEIDPSVADGVRSLVLPQVTNGIAVRMAVLFRLLAADQGGAV
jgi:aspartate carbamoyltransferase catalytic subunit